MLTSLARARLTVVLVGARNPQNIGAAARAMQNFGFSDLRVVNSFAAPFEAAQLEHGQLLEDPAPKSAVGAQGVMAAAQRFDELNDAIADCTFVAGTTAIGGRGLVQPVVTIQEAAPRVRAALDFEPPSAASADRPPPRVALLFGSEKTGLTNEQLSFCHVLTTVPMFAPAGKRHLSMNLGQAVAVCLYELVREGSSGTRELPATSAPGATSSDRERLTERLAAIMERTGYARRFPANARGNEVRRMAQALGATHLQAATWLGLLRQIERAVPSHDQRSADPQVSDADRPVSDKD